MSVNYYKNNIWYHVRKMKGYNAIFSCEYDLDLYRKMRTNCFDIQYNMQGKLIHIKNLQLEEDHIVCVNKKESLDFTIDENKITGIRFVANKQDILNNLIRQNYKDRKNTIENCEKVLENWNEIENLEFYKKAMIAFNTFILYLKIKVLEENNDDIKMQYKKIINILKNFNNIETKHINDFVNFAYKIQAEHALAIEKDEKLKDQVFNYQQTKNERKQ